MRTNNIGSKQLQVLRLLHAHRMLASGQVRSLAFERASRRACEICLQRLHRRAWVVRYEPLQAGYGGGRSGYVYALSEQGAGVLQTVLGVPRDGIPFVAGAEALEARYVNHQLAVNRCLLAVRQACRARGGAALRHWSSDPHARIRYRVGKSWRVVHPDGVAEIEWSGATLCMFFEVDRGTAELRRYRLKLRRYARFFLSGTWRARYARFPQVRIVTAHRPRVRRMLAVIEDALRGFGGGERDALAAGLVVAAAWEQTFLADPSAAVWARAFAADVREPLLPRGGEGEAAQATRAGEGRWDVP